MSHSLRLPGQRLKIQQNRRQRIVNVAVVSLLFECAFDGLLADLSRIPG